MATFPYTIDDTILPEVVTAIAFRMNYDTNKKDAETKNQFAQRMIKETIRNQIKGAVTYYRRSLVTETSVVVETEYTGKIT